MNLKEEAIIHNLIYFFIYISFLADYTKSWYKKGLVGELAELITKEN